MGEKRINIGGIKGVLLALGLVLTLLLGACGSVTIDPSADKTPAASSRSIAITEIVPSGSAKNTVASEEATATAVVAPTPTTESRPTIINQSGPTATPLPKPTATPTLSGPVEKLDRNAELKVVKNAYDAIYRNLYREPDTKELLQASLQELSQITGVAVPVVSFINDSDKNWDIFSQAFNTMLDQAKDFKYPKYQLAHRVVNAMADAVGDEHTYYLEASGYQSRQDLLSGNNSSIGFGIVVTTQDGKAYITQVVSGGPAEKAGAKPGDQITQYDNQPIDDKNWTLIRDAKENETHKFALARPGEYKPVTLNITKRKYSLPTVEFHLIDGHIGYIAIRDFFTNVGDETDRAMNELRQQGADSWILDVRDNPGGVNVEQVMGRFVNNGEIMGYTIDRKHREPVKVNGDLTGGPNKGKPFAPLLPMVLLMNAESASSSEILALGVRDFQLGPLIGVKTSGALGHTAAYPLGDGSAISVTVDEYEAKNGERVNNIGVTPDIEVKMSIQDLVAGRDPQLKAGTDYLEKLMAKK
jgi:carboxyl-terminal processing protease